MGNNVRPLEMLSFLLLGWRDVNVQHDVAEFLLHVLPRVSWLHTSTGWETRTVQDGQVHRQVNSNMPILMLNPAEGLIVDPVSRQRSEAVAGPEAVQVVDNGTDLS